VALRKLLPVVAALVAATSFVFVVASAVPAAAQEVVQDEGAAYRDWHAANQANDLPKSMAAAKAYLAKYPGGQYAEFLTKWLTQARFSALDAAIKAQKMDEMIRIGREILATDPDNLNVLYALAFNLRLRELLAAPQKLDHAKDAQELAQKAISLVESGKTLAGVPNFDKDATLGWLYQVLAVVEAADGHDEKALGLYEKSSSFAPDDVAVAGRNLLSELAMRQGGYAEAAKAYNALPDADRAAAEPNEQVKAAHDRLNAEADGLIDVAARFVAFGRAKSLPTATVDKVNEILETVYKTRFPEDATLDGLKKILDEKSGAKAPGA
jgi:tetratricopeptide (TPR) repeat protein